MSFSNILQHNKQYS